ncbi:PLP-dependent aspartate aminotransferase family protein [Kineosporia sp. A_224]|uniref:trans-sulfuration enzyme family protein n=1 Tax=Kineosporia sp. A_224 TaxID=1962180 RepID=UPI000B4C02CC|nr:aminotransferase class I/II-fold pyridoxal phosphate-dependent enzyme [Kineosporia sp. A_224]
MSPATLAVCAGRPEKVPGAPVNTPVVLSSTYVAAPPGGAPGPVYGRFTNETWTAFETALGALEGGDALVYASGMAAIGSALALLPEGGRLVVPRNPYSGTMIAVDALAAAGRAKVETVDLADTDAVVAALDGADVLWVETPSNPLVEVADLPALVAAAHARGVLVVADNTFATPLVLRPLDHGVDVVVHSVTKYLAGHSDVVLGAAVTRRADLLARLTTDRTVRGAIAGPFEAYLATRGIRTLALRVERAQTNAVVLAQRLAAHPKVSRVRHPSLPDDPGHARAAAQMQGFGAIVSVEVHGGGDAAERFAGAVRLWLHATSLGGVESSLERRRRWPAEALTVPEGLVRLSVGIEDVEDLWADLAQALEAL